jgi:hypothetical protein
MTTRPSMSWRAARAQPPTRAEARARSWKRAGPHSTGVAEGPPHPGKPAPRRLRLILNALTPCVIALAGP